MPDTGWSAEELYRLKEAILGQQGQVPKDWAIIAKHVGSRSENACKSKDQILKKRAGPDGNPYDLNDTGPAVSTRRATK